MALRDIIGQDRAIRILLRTIERDRIPSSYLFAGESGIGKRLAAINLAKALNCLAVDSDSRGVVLHDCCDACPSCKKIDANIHPDFRLISPESGQIRIEEIREIDDMLSLTAFEGRCKTVIVDDAENMNQSAANAFLKTLEEPPGHSLIVLITANPEQLPDTVRSRCARINFMPLSLNAGMKVLRQGLLPSGERDGKAREAPRSEMQESHLMTLMRLSLGRPGNALTENLTEQRTRHLELLQDMMNMGRDGWSSREEMERWINFILVLLRDMAVMKIRGGEKYLINVDMMEFITRLNKAGDLKDIIEQYQKVSALKKHIRFNLNKSLTWNYTGFLLRDTMGDIHA